MIKNFIITLIFITSFTTIVLANPFIVVNLAHDSVGIETGETRFIFNTIPLSIEASLRDTHNAPNDWGSEMMSLSNKKHYKYGPEAGGMIKTGYTYDNFTFQVGGGLSYQNIVTITQAGIDDRFKRYTKYYIGGLWRTL